MGLKFKVFFDILGSVFQLKKSPNRLKELTRVPRRDLGGGSVNKPRGALVAPPASISPALVVFYSITN